MRFFSLTFIVMVCSSLACGTAKLQGGAASKEQLVNNFVVALSQGNADTVRSFLVRKKEFVEGIHPYTPEAKNVTGEYWWNEMLIKRRDLLTSGLLKKFSNKTCRAEITGKEKKVEKHGPVTFYRQIPVKILCGDKENLYGDENRSLFGIVVEKDGVYKVLNIFHD